MVKKKVLDIDRESVRQRMEAGEQMDVAAVWKATATGTYKWAYSTLYKWRKAGLIYVAQWHKRSDGGQPQPTYAWGLARTHRAPLASQHKTKRGATWKPSRPTLSDTPTSALVVP